MNEEMKELIDVLKDIRKELNKANQIELLKSIHAAGKMSANAYIDNLRSIMYEQKGTDIYDKKFKKI